MKINACEAVFPSRVITVDETVDLISHYSKDTFDGDLKYALRMISHLLRASGSNKRRWLDSKEKAIDLVIQATEKALNNANCSKHDIDLVIYSGVGRGFIEPGNSYMIAKALGIMHAECFDISDACMSFVRALNIADNFFINNQYQTALIINAEFNNIPGSILFPKNYALPDIGSIECTLPTYTVGDVASAFIVSKSNHEWEWHFKSRNDLSHLCTAPLEGYKSYISENETQAGKNGVGRFCSFGGEMHDKGFSECIEVYNHLKNKNAVKIFPHSSSKKAWHDGAAKCNVADKMFYVYPEYGNLVSASVPAGMFLAEKEGQIKKNDRLIGWVGSAGMSFSAFSFIY